jgi:hypothetical protein
VDPRAGLDAVVRRKIPNTCRDLNPIKGKVVPVFFLTEHHAMEAYWGVEV